MLPIPPKIGQIRCTIMRDKSGWNKFYPKYIMKLSDNQKNLLTGKKRAHNATSNYQITLDESKLQKGHKGVLGKVRANFLGTEFYIYDDGLNPSKAKVKDQMRAQ
jgi:tubby-related protein 1